MSHGVFQFIVDEGLPFDQEGVGGLLVFHVKDGGLDGLRGSFDKVRKHLELDPHFGQNSVHRFSLDLRIKMR